MVAIDTLKLRIINNHELTIIGIHCAVCIYLLVPKVPGFKLRFAERHEFYRFLISSLRMTVIVIYFWTLVHKLNSGFVNTEISCAAMQLFNLQNKTLVGIKLTFIPTGDWARILAIYSTLVIEGAIPVLLLFKKTRVDGVFLGFFLHLILGFAYPNFSVTMYVFLILFLPPEYWVSLVRWWQSDSGLRHRALGIAQPENWAKVRRYLEYGAIAVAVVYLVFGRAQSELTGWRIHVRLDVGLAVELLMIAVAISVMANMRRHGRPAGETLSTGAFWPRGFACALPLVLFINGFSPHLGLKSTLSYAMFSNLRAEGGTTNHLLFRRRCRSGILKKTSSLSSPAATWRCMTSVCRAGTAPATIRRFQPSSSILRN